MFLLLLSEFSREFVERGIVRSCHSLLTVIVDCIKDLDRVFDGKLELSLNIILDYTFHNLYSYVFPLFYLNVNFSF